MKLKGKRVTSIVIVFMLLFSSFSFVYATEEPVIDKENIEKERVKYKKDQTIYVVLNSDGTVDQTIVMNRLFDYVGDELIDTGDYKNIKAISQNIKPVVTDHEITWNLTANEKDFYYEGEVTSELPITVSLKYFLNGEELTAKQIAGTTGQLRININVKQNKNVDRMHSNAYLTQIQFPVDLKKVEILEAPKAMQIVTGTVATISYSVMPDSDADYSLLLDVKNFEMDAMNISLISYDPMDENQYEELTDGLIEMEDGAKELSKGTGKLRDGLAKLVDAIKELVDGLFKLADGGN
jgi:X-X-X-Leu-X-X-Gly heptad repeat protein